ncbi:uncharacterized protein LOC126800971 [Argentina anserina]|uniref:uncharacterized protein LOC126800971 n=1 Tax=Argentina anserina TaxID=57926 RepID=UPI002176275C|nr:uncharacterized protein LOC126800971 [Potentilla anserina]
MGSLKSEEAARKKAMWLYPNLAGFNPSARWGHSACYYQGNMYVFGGCSGGMHYSDVLVLNFETMVWNTLVTTGQGPGPRDSHSTVVLGDNMIVFGGTSGSKKCNDLHILNLMTKEWTRPEYGGTPPSPRESHSATLVDDEELVVFGGSGEGECMNDLHVLNLKTMRWTSPEVKGDIPVPRDSHSAIAMGKKMLVYGGDRGDSYYGDVDMLDMNTMTWTRLAVQGSSPGGRAGHAAVSIGTQVYIIGGVGHKRYYNDTWVLDSSTCSWTQLDVCGQMPQGRFSHTAVITDSHIAVYGGCGEDDRPLNELLVLQLGTEQPYECYDVPICKIFGSHLNQERRRFSRGANINTNVKPLLMGNPVAVGQTSNKSGSEQKRSSLHSDTLHPKRRRTTTAGAREFKSEQEEHSLSMSQHSSSSHSDQELQQTPITNLEESAPPSQGFHIFKQLNQSPNIKILEVPAKDIRFSTQSPEELSHLLGAHQMKARREQYLHGGPSMHFQTAEHIPVVAANPMRNFIGSEVHGKVDGEFDSGFLMTATVNGNIFRGVLFAPVSFKYRTMLHNLH